MNNLYWIDNKIMKLYDRFTDAETGELCDWKDAETGEVIAPAEDFLKQLAALDMERGDVIENLLLGYKNNTAEAEAIKAEVKRLTARMKACEKQAERMKAAAEDALQGEKFHTARVAVSWRKSTATEVDETICPKRWMVVKTAPDKKAIAAALKAGQKIKGCKLVERMSMSVR